MDIENLSTVSEDAGTLVHFKDVTKQPMFFGEGDDQKPLTATVAGTFSQRYRDALKRIRSKNLANAHGGNELEVDALDDNNLELEVACILAWDLSSGGKPFPITAANWKAVLAKQPQWQEQVQAAMNGHSRFFNASSPR
ncbi:MAG TPA: hypothetical protein VGM50_23000 [Gemmatimonadaceae bacterium]|jgi:hypothetical protein